MFPPPHSLNGPMLSLVGKPASHFHDKSCMLGLWESCLNFLVTLHNKKTWLHTGSTTPLFSTVLLETSLTQLPSSYSNRMTSNYFSNAIMNQSVTHRTVHRNALPGWTAKLVSWMVSEKQIASGCRIRWLYSWPKKTQKHTKTPLGDELLEIRRPTFLGPDSKTILPP